MQTLRWNTHCDLNWREALGGYRNHCWVNTRSKSSNAVFSNWASSLYLGLDFSDAKWQPSARILRCISWYQWLSCGGKYWFERCPSHNIPCKGKLKKNAPIAMVWGKYCIPMFCSNNAQAKIAAGGMVFTANFVAATTLHSGKWANNSRRTGHVSRYCWPSFSRVIIDCDINHPINRKNALRAQKYKHVYLSALLNEL